MLFTTNNIKSDDLNNVNNFLNAFDNEFDAVKTVDAEDVETKSPVSLYISSLVCGQYAKSVEDIENTVVGNKIVRKRNLQQIMKESFFYGANRFGNNFIA